MERLEGKDLITKVKSLGEMDKKEKAKVCGYVSRSKSGKERVLMGQFLEALLEAEGIDLESGDKRKGRAPSYRLTVQSNYTVLIGSTYIKEMGLKLGDWLDIKVGRTKLQLVKVEAEE